MCKLFNIYCILILAVLAFTSTSCKKFLESYSQNDSFIENGQDLKELLIGGGYMPYVRYTGDGYALYLDDDIQIAIGGQTAKTTIYNIGYYYWSADPRVDSEGKVTETDPYYAKLYQKISVLNTIFEAAGKLKDKGIPAQEIEQIEAEAYYLRALYYFQLVNYYGKPYNIATASADYGVPFKLEPAIKEQFAVMASVETIYNQIVSDLELAAKQIGTANEGSHVRAHATNIYAFLSRVLLYMERYEQAAYYADLAIKDSRFKLVDLNDFDFTSSFALQSNPEVMFTMEGSPLYSWSYIESEYSATIFFQPSDELINLYEPADLRINAFFHKTIDNRWRIGKSRKNNEVPYSDVYSVRLAEAYLNKAEALAAQEKFAEANSTLFELRKMRFAPGTVSLTNLQGTQLINFIREERRRELCYDGHRWFDLRRYAVNSKYKFQKSTIHPAVEHNGSRYVIQGYYELPPYDEDPAGYVLPISRDEINFNQGNLINEPRIERPLKF